MSSSGSGDKSGKNDLNDQINQLISENKVMVFSATYCMLEIYFENRNLVILSFI